ncbi:unnamed protein product [Owenia fusiformis]|uniref:Solute carrier organic anion transporter family member n=1 Tax=Owenia fusiformis TaxID=6347 RepID=A0A8J1TZ24_OWEFU|nr:unnamed protein product [Owenia fusiformis]
MADEEACGLGQWRPKSLQKLNTLKYFTGLLCLLTFLNGTEMSYRVSTLTTLEKRFGYQTSAFGFILAASDMSYVPALIILSYFANRFSIPKVISIAAILLCIASFLWQLPHYIFKNGHTTNLDIILENKTMIRQRSSGLCNTALSSNGYHNIDDTSVAEACNVAHGTKSNDEYTAVTSIFVISQLIMGVCLVPGVTLGISFIDSTLKQQGTSTYIGMIWGSYYLGFVAGYLEGAIFTSIYIDLSDTKLSPDDPHWRGAWWIGSIITMILALLIIMPLMLFPKSIPHPTAEAEAPEDENEELEKVTANNNEDASKANNSDYEYSIKEFPKVLSSLLTNPVYMGIVVGGVFVCYIMLPWPYFLPKYIETQFYQTASTANIITAVINGVASCSGLFIGGAIQAKLNLSMQGIIRVLMVATVMCGGAMGLLIAFDCEDQFIDAHVDNSGRLNMTNQCNAGCGCSLDDFTPVCSVEKMYFSPCHAGCSNAPFEEGGYTIYENCSCALDYDHVFFAGMCPKDCMPVMVPYIFVAFVILFTTYCTQVLPMSVILQCVKEEERSLALGIHLAVFSLFAFVPGPPIVGKIIDMTCIIWEGGCDDGRCLFYDRPKYRYFYHGVVAALQLGALLAFFLSYSKSKHFHIDNNNPKIRDNEIEGEDDELVRKRGEAENTPDGDIEEAIEMLPRNRNTDQENEQIDDIKSVENENYKGISC